jgi:hypothetical protein
MSELRAAMPTSLDTAGLRALGADVLARSAFTARGTNAIFASKLKEVIDELAAGNIGEGQARTALYETLDALGYDVEQGGFPGEEVPPALKGSIQDLRTFRRMDLIIRTQLDLMEGAGQRYRGSLPEALQQFPAWELVRVLSVSVPRDWPARWIIAGGLPRPDGRMIALKGDPVWGELGGAENFPDALGVDHPPFAFNSGMGWAAIPSEEVDALGITGPNGESPEEWLASQPTTMGGKMPLPTPRNSMDGVAPELVENFQQSTSASPTPGKPQSFDFSDILAEELAAADAAYQKGARTR